MVPLGLWKVFRSVPWWPFFKWKRAVHALHISRPSTPAAPNGVSPFWPPLSSKAHTVAASSPPCSPIPAEKHQVYTTVLEMQIQSLQKLNQRGNLSAQDAETEYVCGRGAHFVVRVQGQAQIQLKFSSKVAPNPKRLFNDKAWTKVKVQTNKQCTISK